MPVAYCVWGLSNIGLLYDTSVWGWASELLRHGVTFVMSRCHVMSCHDDRCAVTVIFLGSLGQLYSAALSSQALYSIFSASAALSFGMTLASTKTKAKVV